MDAVKFLTTCALVEDRAAEIYHTMEATARTLHNEELESLWKEMAADEENHAHQVRLATRLSRQGIFETLSLEEESLPFSLLQRAETLLSYVKSGPLNELEMLKVAIELEKQFCKVHTTYNIVFKETSMQKMFNALARADNKHMDGLKNRIEKYTKASSA